ncbi:unnamed protein product [Chrysoparadoxa australica]
MQVLGGFQMSRVRGRLPKPSLFLVAAAIMSLQQSRALCTAPSMPCKHKRLVFLGTPEVSVTSLKVILEGAAASHNDPDNMYEVVGVVTQPPAPTGRRKKITPSPVQVLAEQEGIPVLAPAKAKDEEFLQQLRDMAPDLCVTAAYGQFLPTKFLKIPVLGTLNIHPSLLPKYRGASPVQRALEAGDTETGVTVAFTVLKMDSGPVVSQVKCQLEGHEKATDLLQELFTVGSKELVRVLPSVWSGGVEVTEQDESQATAADKLSAAEAQCCFEKETASKIHNKVRGFAGWPGTWCELLCGEGEGKDPSLRRVKINTTAVDQGQADLTNEYVTGVHQTTQTLSQQDANKPGAAVLGFSRPSYSFLCQSPALVTQLLYSELYAIPLLPAE